MRRRLVVAAAVCGGLFVIGGGTTAVLCKVQYQCGIGNMFQAPVNGAANDKALLGSVRKAAKNSPKGVLVRGFRETIVASGFTLPDDFTFLTPSRILVSEKDGRILEWSSRTHRSRVVLNLTPRIDTSLFRGVITVASDPDYARNHFIYVLFALKPHSKANEATTVARLSRFVLRPGASATDEHVLLGSVFAPSCAALPATADCLSSDLDHDGAQIAFARDGTLFVSTGDGGGHDERVEPSAMLAPDPDALAGKVLHINRSGDGLPDNPYWNGDPSANRSKVWAVGLRNPWRLTLDPRTGVPIVGDVGVGRQEEIDAVSRGSNQGWPCWEGRLESLTYRHTPFCVRFYHHPPANLRKPLLVSTHIGGSGSIVGGTFAPSSFGVAYRNRYFFGDWIHGWIRTAVVDQNDTRAYAVRAFAHSEPGPAAIKVGPDGALYLLALNSGDLRRITATR